MQLPQELVDIIIDMVSVFEDTDDRKSTLLSCALLSRAFAGPSQRNLFSTVQLYPYNHNSFAALLSSSPHIGTFVRTFMVEYNADPHPSRPFAVTTILAALPYLECICLWAWAGIQPICNASPEFFDACRRACSLPTVRRIELKNQVFADAMELESLLGNSTGLRELSLESISFKSLRVARVPSSRSITLESLVVAMIDEEILECILDAFTTVDVKHLRSLRFELAVVCPILGVNAGSLRELGIQYDYDLFPVGDTFIGHSKLQSIYLDVTYGEHFGQIIASLGQLSDLRRLIMHVRDDGVWTPDNEADWTAVDRALSATQDLRSLEEIHIRARPRIWGEGITLEGRFPLLAQKDLLHVFQISFDC